MCVPCFVTMGSYDWKWFQFLIEIGANLCVALMPDCRLDRDSHSFKKKKKQRAPISEHKPVPLGFRKAVKPVVALHKEKLPGTCARKGLYSFLCEMSNATKMSRSTR